MLIIINYKKMVFLNIPNNQEFIIYDEDSLDQTVNELESSDELITDDEDANQINDDNDSSGDNEINWGEIAINYDEDSDIVTSVIEIMRIENLCSFCNIQCNTWERFRRYLPCQRVICEVSDYNFL